MAFSMGVGEILIHSMNVYFSRISNMGALNLIDWLLAVLTIHTVHYKGFILIPDLFMYTYLLFNLGFSLYIMWKCWGFFKIFTILVFSINWPACIVTHWKINFNLFLRLWDIFIVFDECGITNDWKKNTWPI